MDTSATPALAAIARAAASAGGRLENTNAPGASKSRLRVATMLGRPGKGRRGKLSQVLRPITSGVFAVMLRKFAMSALRRKSSLFSNPSSPRLPIAATILTPIGSVSCGKPEDAGPEDAGPEDAGERSEERRVGKRRKSRMC